MRKSLIAQSVAALIGALGLAAGANAAVVGPAAGPVNGVPVATVLEVNTDGLGHINLVPYYSVQNGNDTYISITNTDTKNAKAVKVRFRGAGNSDDVFDITVLMSPGDVWAASITKDAATGLPMLDHGDASCTLPKAVKAKFVTTRVDSTLDAAGKANQTREGYVEILNMADIPTGSDLYDAIKHNSSGVAACTPADLDTLFTDSVDYADALAKGLAVPTTGLMTNWTIINVPRASSWSGAAVAVEARAAAGGAAGWGNIVLFPQAATPVTTVNAALWSSDPLLISGDVTAAFYDFPDLSTPYLKATVDPKVQAAALTGSLAVTSVTNEYVTEGSLQGKTDWVFSMPTRRYSVALKYSDNTAKYTVLPVDYFTSANIVKTGRQLCVKDLFTASPAPTTAEPDNRVNAVTANREEGFLESATEFVISPGEPTAPLTFCGEVSVLTFNGKSVLGASVATKDLTFPADFVNGWVRISTPGLAGVGLPIIGTAMVELYNANATAGVAGGYGLTFPHRATRP